MGLRNYQKKGESKALSMHDAGRQSLCLVMPPGGGKTYLGSHIGISISQKRQGRLLWVAHRRELIKQAKSTLERIGYNVGVIAPWAKMDLSHPVQVASIQTIRNLNLDDLPPFACVVWDEAHHAMSDDWVLLAKECRRRRSFILGLTATPERRDGRGMYPLFGSMLVVATQQQLIADGHLVPTEVLIPPRVIKDGVADAPVTLWEKHTPGTKTIVFCESVDHARRVADEFDARGYSADYVEGEMTSRERDRIMNRFISGRLDILTNCQILTEGFDLPPIQTVVLARRVGSHALYLQMVGRGSRPFKGKTKSTLLDLTGSAKLYGLPDEDRTYSLKGRPISLKKPERVNNSKRCLRCSLVFYERTNRCPNCGSPVGKSKESKVYSDKLHKMGPGEAEAYEKAALDRFKDYAQIHSKGDDWVEERFFRKFGRLPKGS